MMLPVGLCNDFVNLSRNYPSNCNLHYLLPLQKASHQGNTLTLILRLILCVRGLSLHHPSSNDIFQSVLLRYRYQDLPSTPSPETFKARPRPLSISMNLVPNPPPKLSTQSISTTTSSQSTKARATSTFA
jgi:hypothetical protein